jgi:chromosome segregation ATPase
MSVEALKEASNQLEQTERELEYKQQQNQELEQQLEQRRQQQELEQQQQEQQMQEQQRALDELNRLIEAQECERERNEHVRTQVQHWFDSAHIIQPVREVEPIQINDRVQTFEFHEKALNPLSPTHDYVLKEDFDKVLTQVKEYEKQLNNQVRDVNRAIEDVNQDNQHNYEVERANEALKARNEVLELDCHKYELEDVNSLNKSLEAEKGQLQQELNKAKVEIQELNQANKELEQENDNLVHQNNILKDTLERIVEFVDKALQPVIENPIIETLCSYLKREEKETVKEAESEYYKSKAVEERVVSYDRDDSYDLER